MAATLRRVIEQHGSITLNGAELPDRLMGCTDFERHEVTVDERLSLPQWRTTLVHELVHLRRGPVPVEAAAREEAAVQREATDILVPAGSALSQLDSAWAGWEVDQLAAVYAVDRETMLDAIAPQVPDPRLSVDGLIGRGIGKAASAIDLLAS